MSKLCISLCVCSRKQAKLKNRYRNFYNPYSKNKELKCIFIPFSYLHSILMPSNLSCTQSAQFQNALASLGPTPGNQYAAAHSQ